MPCSQDNGVFLEPKAVSPFTHGAFQHVCTLHIGINASFVIKRITRKLGAANRTREMEKLSKDGFIVKYM